MPTSLNVIERVAGTTVRPTWVNPGVTPTSISSALLDADEQLVNSVAAISSGGGYFYALHTLPNSRAWYVNEWSSVINGYPYKHRQFVRALKPEVD